MVPDDYAHADSGQPHGVPPREPGKTHAPEEERKPWDGHEVAEESDVLRREAVVKQRLDDGERARPADHDGQERRMGRKPSIA